LRIAGPLIAVSYLVAGVAPNASVATAALTAEAIAVAIGVVAHISLRQRLVDPTMLGRVGNIFRTATMGIMPIGAFLGGLLAQTLSLRAPLLAASIVQALVAGFAFRRLKPERPTFTRSLSVDRPPWHGSHDRATARDELRPKAPR
jgi:MFS family permease